MCCSLGRLLQLWLPLQHRFPDPISWVDPSHTDMCYGHETCFDQWNIRRHDTNRGFPGGSVVKKKKKNAPVSARDTGDVGSIPESGRSPGEGNGNPLQYSCLENPMDRGAWQAAVHGVEKSQSMHAQLST